MTGMPPRLLSVNVAQPKEMAWVRGHERSSIDKRPVTGPVRAEPLGLAGDQVADTKHHGGVHQAVYVFSREDLDLWGERLGRRFENGQFGENFTTQGIDVNSALLGEQWRIGSAVFEVAEVRIPCNTFKNWLGLLEVDNAGWLKRFTAEGRPGGYLRIIEPGVVEAGNEIHVLSRPSHDITVATMFRAFTTDRSLLPRLLEVGDTLAPKPRAVAEQAARDPAGVSYTVDVDA
jgi:MOSC domain-containing protein YiiM